MEGASGINKKVAYKRPIKRISLEIQDPPPPAHDADSEAAPAAAGAAAVNGTRPIKAPVTRMAIFQQGIFILKTIGFHE